MKAEDFAPKNRFEVAKQTLMQFAASTVDDRLGLVIFASQAFTQCPLTLDHKMVGELINQVQQGIIKDGTGDRDGDCDGGATACGRVRRRAG